jgi:hypothetical protein
MAFSIKNVRLDGCRPGKPSPRDFRAVFCDDLPVPDRVDLRPYCTTVENQGQLRTCTLNATVGAVEYHYSRRDRHAQDFSRLFVYYNLRRMKGEVNEDPGAEIREAMAALINYGVCIEDLWPYDPTLLAVEPPQDAYKDAMKHQLLQYARVDGGQRAINSLAAGLPVIFAIDVPYRCYEEAAKTAILLGPKPGEREEDPFGRHSMLIVGYDKPAKTFLVRNSWGEEWGDRGYCRIPFDVMESCCYVEDFWVIAELEKQTAFELIRPVFDSVPPPAAPVASTGSGIAETAGRLREQIRSSLTAGIDAYSRKIDAMLTGGVSPNAGPRNDLPRTVPLAPPDWENWKGHYFKASFPSEWSTRENTNGITINDPTGYELVSFAYVSGGFAPSQHEQVRSAAMQAIGIETPRFIKESEPQKVGFGITRVSEFSGNRDRTPTHGIISVTIFDICGSYGYCGYLRMGPADQWTEISSKLEQIERSIVLLSGKHTAFQSLSGL